MQLFAIDLAGPWYLDQVQTEVLRFGDNDGHVNESWEDFKQFWPLKNHVTRHDGMIGFNLGKVCSEIISEKLTSENFRYQQMRNPSVLKKQHQFDQIYQVRKCQ